MSVPLSGPVLGTGSRTRMPSSMAVLGAGSWGTALSLLLARNGHTVFLWDHDPLHLSLLARDRVNARYCPEVQLPESIQITPVLSEALALARDILIVVPSHAFASILGKIKACLVPTQRIVWATKGMSAEGSELLDQVFERVLGNAYAYAVLSGPSFASEVAQGLPTAVDIASADPAFAADLQRCFENEFFRVHVSTDLMGVQLGGVFKNVLALAVGLSDGLHFGANARAVLMTQGLAQLIRLGVAMGAQLETFIGLSGCGDIILSCTTDQSRNRRFGLALAEGLSSDQALKRIGQVVEALYNVEQLRDLGMRYQIALPIVEQVRAVMRQEVSASEALKALF